MLALLATLAFLPNIVQAATIQGKIDLQDCSTNGQAVQLDLCDATSNGNCISQIVTLTPNSAGTLNYSISANAGTYTLGVKGRKWLHATQAVNIPNANSIVTSNFSLFGGDANDDNFVDSLDYALFVEAFGSVSGDPNYNINTDFDCDGEISTLDYSILISNFGAVGADFKPSAVILSDLKITQNDINIGGMKSGETATGTVFLNYPAKANIIATVKSSHSQVKINGSQTANVTIPAGNFSANFNITTTGTFTSATNSQISATLGSYAQIKSITIFPTNQSFVVQNLNAAPGNGCALVFWDGFPENSVQGYHVYRTIGGTTTRLTTTPIQSATYVDSNLTANSATTCQYKVSVVNALGVEQTLSSAVSIQTSATAPRLLWKNQFGNVSENTQFYSLLSNNKSPSFTSLLVDGEIVSHAGTVANELATGLQANLDTTTLSNGIHVVQMLGWVNDNTICATPASIINVNNSIGSFTTDDMLINNPQVSGFANIDATLPESTSWQVKIVKIGYDSLNSIVTEETMRSWSGVSSTIHLAWDGKRSDGTCVSEDTYDVKLTANATNGNIIHTGSIFFSFGASASGLALMTANGSGKGSGVIQDHAVYAVVKKAFNGSSDMLKRSKDPAAPFGVNACLYNFRSKMKHRCHYKTKKRQRPTKKVSSLSRYAMLGNVYGETVCIASPFGF